MRAMKWICFTVLVLCTGCAGLGKYAKDRGNDFLDCVTALGGFGIGSPAVELHATDCLTTGAGYATSMKWGMVGREEVATCFRQEGLGLFYGSQPVSDLPENGIKRSSKSVLLFDITCIPRYAYHTDDGLFREMGSGPRVQEERRRPIEALDVHIDATAALLIGPSVRLGFSPGQFADFVLGFFGLDIASDDAENQHPKTTEGGRP